MASSGEQVLFDNGGVMVTQYRFVVDNQTYAMQNVTSIRHEIHHPEKPLEPPFKDYSSNGIAFFGGLLLLIVLFDIFRDDVDGGTIGVALSVGIVGLVLLVFGVIRSKRPSLLPESLRVKSLPLPPQPKPIHTVVLTSAALETTALSSTDEGYIGEVISALNQAIVLKG